MTKSHWSHAVFPYCILSITAHFEDFPQLLMVWIHFTTTLIRRLFLREINGLFFPRLTETDVSQFSECHVTTNHSFYYFSTMKEQQIVLDTHSSAVNTVLDLTDRTIAVNICWAQYMLTIFVWSPAWFWLLGNTRDDHSVPFYASSKPPAFQACQGAAWNSLVSITSLYFSGRQIKGQYQHVFI